MKWELTLILIAFLFSGGLCLGECPSADLTGDCFVDYEDFALIANQWLTGDPCAPDGMFWVDINDPGAHGHEGFNGEMSQYETTNGQYCQFLNAVLASGDIYVNSNTVYGSNGSNSGADFVDERYFETFAADDESQITYSGGTFTVRTRDGYDMSDHPVVEVSWYGATAFCNYYGYRLPTEREWQAVADFDGSYAYGCGMSINSAKANYYLGYWSDEEHWCNPVRLSSYPYTSPVDYYLPYGYGMNDMAGNVWEWTSTVSGDSHVLCGGSWGNIESDSHVGSTLISYPGNTFNDGGFRVCR